MESSESVRVDKALVQRGLVLSRARAALLVLDGKVGVNGEIVRDRTFMVRTIDEVALLSEDIPWVSRAGLKLVHALDYFGVDPKGKVALDIGASTGGFTDVLLSRGATRVYALDVGHDQLATKLLKDARVVDMSGTHINEVSRAQFAPEPSLIVVDVSFISLTKILHKVKELGGDNGQVLLLVKPQFEVGREFINKGIVKDPVLHERVISDIFVFAEALGFTVSDAIPSPILGGDGNKEFLLYLSS